MFFPGFGGDTARFREPISLSVLQKFGWFAGVLFLRCLVALVGLVVVSIKPSKS